MRSPNGQYYMTSIPYEHINVISGDLCSGETKVYFAKNDSLLFTIGRYFGVDNSFLSDSATIAYTNDYWTGTSYDSCSNDILEFYKNGSLLASYSFEELFDSISGRKDYKWLYSNYKENQWLIKNNHYQIGNDLYTIANKSADVMIWDMATAKLKQKVDTGLFLQNLKYDSLDQNLVDFIPIEDREDLLPNLKNGLTFRKAIKQDLNLELAPNTGPFEAGRQYFYIFLEVKIDSSGNCLEAKVSTNEHVMRGLVDSLRNRIKHYILKSKFKIGRNPYEMDHWVYEDRFYVSRNPLSLAKIDYQNYWDEICSTDTIAGIYIPKDLTDAFAVLDKELDDSSKVKLKNGESSHFGLGMWMRNNWGLWGGGRLKCYFDDRELHHPDHISSLIISAYQLKLNKKEIDQDSLILEYSKMEKEWMKR